MGNANSSVDDILVHPVESYMTGGGSVDVHQGEHKAGVLLVIEICFEHQGVVKGLHTRSVERLK